MGCKRQTSLDQGLIIHLAGSHLPTWRYQGHWATMNTRSSAALGSGPFNLHFQTARIPATLVTFFSPWPLSNLPPNPHPLPLFTEVEEMAKPCGTQSVALSITSFIQLMLPSALTQESDSLSPSSDPWEALICALGSSEGVVTSFGFLDS